MLLGNPGALQVVDLLVDLAQGIGVGGAEVAPTGAVGDFAQRDLVNLDRHRPQDRAAAECVAHAYGRHPRGAGTDCIHLDALRPGQFGGAERGLEAGVVDPVRKQHGDAGARLRLAQTLHRQPEAIAYRRPVLVPRGDDLEAAGDADEIAVVERQRAGSVGVAREGDDADGVIGPAGEAIAADNELLEDRFDGVQPAELLVLRRQIERLHRARDVHHHHDGDAFAMDLAVALPGPGPRQRQTEGGGTKGDERVGQPGQLRAPAAGGRRQLAERRKHDSARRPAGHEVNRCRRQRRQQQPRFAELEIAEPFDHDTTIITLITLPCGRLLAIPPLSGAVLFRAENGVRPRRPRATRTCRARRRRTSPGRTGQETW